MCELFGISSPKPIKTNDLLHEFFSHGMQHPDGWGMAFFYGNEVSLEKQPINACKSMYLKARLTAHTEAQNMIAHIRLATKGHVEYENTHPFVMKDAAGRTWTLAHNGTIFESQILDPMFYHQKGHTDSERILLYFIKQWNKALEEGAADDAEKRFALLDRIIHEITPENKVNLLLYDGELMYVHTNYRGSLHMKQQGKTRIFSTQPLDSKDWQPVPMNTLLAFQNGELRFRGVPHENEYFYNADKAKHLYLDYALL